jgi:hypothetical protein
MTKGYTLRAECLASKWGFGDGDGLQDYCYDLKDGGLIPDTPERDGFLYAVVMKYLVPELDRRGIKADIVKIGSNHNPVRAETVNGIEVDHFNGPCPECLVGVEALVPWDDLIAMAKGIDVP